MIIMIVIMSTRTLGEPSFDSVFYLSYVVEGAESFDLVSLAYESGEVLDSVYTLYDFQAFYHLNSFFL